MNGIFAEVTQKNNYLLFLLHFGLNICHEQRKDCRELLSNCRCCLMCLRSDWTRNSVRIVDGLAAVHTGGSRMGISAERFFEIQRKSEITHLREWNSMKALANSRS